MDEQHPFAGEGRQAVATRDEESGWHHEDEGGEATTRHSDDHDATPAPRSSPAAAPRRIDAEAVPRWAAWLAGAVLALLAAWCVYDLTRPFGPDHSVFSLVGDAIVRGGLPYRDAWETKGPVAYYAIALTQLLFGRNEWGLRLFDLLVMVPGAIVLARIAGTVTRGSRVGAFVAGVLFLLWYASLDHANSAQPDGWAAVLLAASVLVALRHVRNSPLRAGAAAGALTGVAVLIKPTYVLFIVLPALLVLRSPGPAGRKFWLTAAGVAAGSLLVVLAAWGWFAAHGATGDLLDVHVRWTATVYAGLGNPWLIRLEEFAFELMRAPLGPALPLVAAGAVALWRRDRDAALVLIVWGLCASASLVIQGKYSYLYQWIPLYAPLAVLAGVGAGAAARAFLAPMRGAPDVAAAGRWMLAASTLVALGAAAFAPTFYVWRWGKAHLRGDEARLATYEEREYGPVGRHPASMHAVAQYVGAHAAPSDRVLVWGINPLPNFITGRQSPTRFATDLPLILGEQTPFRAAYRGEFMRAVATSPPAYVVALDDAECARLIAADKATWGCLMVFPDLQRFVERNYRLEARIGEHDVFRRVQ